MASRLSKLEAEKLAIIQQSMSNRGRSLSPSGNNSRSSSALADDFNNREMKWSIINHDPLERIQGENSTGAAAGEEMWDDENSEEEHISDDYEGEKFEYNGTGNILPNYACHDEKMTEISSILEHSNLNDQETIKKLEELTANERAVANAKKIGSNVDNDVVAKLAENKHALTGQDKLDLNKSDQDAESRRQKLEAYQAYRRKIIHQENDNLRGRQSPSSKKSDDTTTEGSDASEFMIPYTSAVEDKLDSEFAFQLNETIKEGEVDSNISQSRVIQTITRGNFFQLINPQIKPKMFLLCMDFSPESIFALEWCLGTVLVDGSVLFIVCVIEDNDTNHQLKGNTLNESARESARLNMLNRAKQQVLNLLKLTKLQLHIVIEIIHHPIPRHLILECIDNLQPTLVVVGSKGLSAIKGVLLGSLSNYLVTKSSVPVMVVREKLKKINRFKSGSSIFSNNIKPLTLSEARVD
ncbi:adenine nucleotide alpha hydrolases-like protein [Metschnikowia bicuspidata var. bicuspidata NRRL YB-4993]|uniref:Adenine nucleotide alpha hydrolases-like protein n=1 Tax=Metschnikowia bicuspidata var. bicuspidata NRRL YB-4993 TaxID=869754 RepID=A0A1A0HKH5_9ASCO|nr:adenine nucleotide alpha hydrolases-like protein [Metschnikowia bicuspidata var. bicuspidata NRRL YB-4993]OBA24491.1 adenine nucleotide alpha hydrolases-like protein [Metschnikowia bicuspidata var. bicuspidata NRRL YB-4993]